MGRISISCSDLDGFDLMLCNFYCECSVRMFTSECYPSMGFLIMTSSLQSNMKSHCVRRNVPVIVEEACEGNSRGCNSMECSLPVRDPVGCNYAVHTILLSVRVLFSHTCTEFIF